MVSVITSYSIHYTKLYDKIDAEVKTAEYGRIVDLATVDFNTDVVFTWNGTTSGVRVANGDAIV